MNARRRIGAQFPDINLSVSAMSILEVVYRDQFPYENGFRFYPAYLNQKIGDDANEGIHEALRELESHGIMKSHHHGDDLFYTLAETAQSEIDHRNKMPYAEFLKSDYWQEVRTRVMARFEERCATCNTAANLHVHHRTYKHRGNELRHLPDVILLCDNCHKLIHSGATIK